MTSAITADNGTVNIYGSLYVDKDAIILNGKSKLNFYGGATLFAENKAIIIGENSDAEVNIGLDSEPAEEEAGYTVTRATISGEYNIIYAPKNAGAYKVNIYSCDMFSENLKGIGIFSAGKNGAINIYGGHISGETAIWIHDGALNIEANDNLVELYRYTENRISDYAPYVASDGYSAIPTGDAVVIEGKNNPSVKFSGKTSNLIVDSRHTEDLTEAIAVYPLGTKLGRFVSAGKYSSDISSYLLPGYFLEKESGYYAVKSGLKKLTDKNVTLSTYTVDFNKDKTPRPEVTVTYAGTELTENEDIYGGDYTVEYKYDQNVGKAYVIVKGEGDYTGTVCKAYYVKGIPSKENLSNTKKYKNGSGKYTVTVIGESFTYCGRAIKPLIIVKMGALLVKPSEYNVSYEDNENAGKAVITVTSKAKLAAAQDDQSEALPQYKGTASFNIQKKALTIIPDSFTRTAATAENENQQTENTKTIIKVKAETQEASDKIAAVQGSFVPEALSRNTNSISFTASAFGYVYKDRAKVLDFISKYLSYVVTDKDSKVVGADSDSMWIRQYELNYPIQDAVSQEDPTTQSGKAFDYSKLEAGIYNINLDYDGAADSVDENQAFILNNYDINISTPGKLVILDRNGKLTGFENNVKIKTLYQSLLEKYNTNSQLLANRLAAALNSSEKYYEGIVKRVQKIQSYWANLKCCKAEDENEGEAKVPGAIYG